MCYLTLCELAMYPPLLPQHASLRGERRDFRQVLPLFRWFELLRTAGQVEPMRGINDRDRYVMDIFQQLGWVQPTQIIRSAVDGPKVVSNPLAMIYLSAQRWRAHDSGSFLGVNRFVFDPSPEGGTWRDAFNFVIIDYADRTTYHPNKAFLQSMTTRHLNMLGMRCIMLGRALTIAAPYRGDSGERQWMTEWLRNRFKNVFGRDFPTLQFV